MFRVYHGIGITLGGEFRRIPRFNKRCQPAESVIPIVGRVTVKVHAGSNNPQAHVVICRDEKIRLPVAHLNGLPDRIGLKGGVIGDTSLMALAVHNTNNVAVGIISVSNRIDIGVLGYPSFLPGEITLLYFPQWQARISIAVIVIELF